MPPAWETYYKQLLPEGHGYAVWEADPFKEPAVELADVGYMVEGTFVRLFNASKNPGDVSNRFGTPDGYEPLRASAVRERMLSATLPITSATVVQRKIDINFSSESKVQAGGGYTFECTKEQGAALILGEDADRTDTLENRAFIEYILDNHAKWLSFANQDLRRVLTLDQLILVTGCDKTSTWACAAFNGESRKSGVDFRVGCPGVAQGGVSVWGSWDNCQSARVNAGPRRELAAREREFETVRVLSGLSLLAHMAPVPSVDPTSVVTTPLDATLVNAAQPLPRNQCVFLRGYKICDRPSMRKRMRRLLKSKEPTDDPFVRIPKRKRDEDGDNERSGRRTWTPSGSTGSPGTSGSSASAGGDGGQGGDTPSGSSSGGQGGTQDTSSESGASGQDGSGPPTISSDTDSSTVGDSPCDGDSEFDAYAQLDGFQEPDALDILMAYILKNDEVEVALVHHTDLAEILNNTTPVSDFEGFVNQVSPEVFVRNGVGMLQNTFKKVVPESSHGGERAVISDTDLSHFLYHDDFLDLDDFSLPHIRNAMQPSPFIRDDTPMETPFLDTPSEAAWTSPLVDAPSVDATDDSAFSDMPLFDPRVNKQSLDDLIDISAFGPLDPSELLPLFPQPISSQSMSPHEPRPGQLLPRHSYISLPPCPSQPTLASSTTRTSINTAVNVVTPASTSNPIRHNPLLAHMRHDIPPASLVPPDSPIQPWKYTAPSATSRNPLPPAFKRAGGRLRSGVDGGENELLQDGQIDPDTVEAIEAKQRQNALVARRSQQRELQRKLEHARELEDAVKHATQDQDI